MGRQGSASATYLQWQMPVRRRIWNGLSEFAARQIAEIATDMERAGAIRALA